MGDVKDATQETGTGTGLGIEQEEKVLLKIKRLLALSRSSNEHEAALAASRAQELLFKYKLDAARVEGVSDPQHRNEKAEGREYEYAPKGKRTQLWRVTLLDTVARNNFCRVVITGRAEQRSSTIVGKISDIECVQYVYGYLSSEIDRIAREKGREAREAYARTGEHVDAFRWYMSFCDGACETVRVKLYDQKRRSEEEGKRIHGEGTTAIVKRDEKLAEVKMHEMFGKLGSMKSTQRSRDAEAREKGREAGGKIGMRRPIGE